MVEFGDKSHGFGGLNTVDLVAGLANEGDSDEETAALVAFEKVLVFDRLVARESDRTEPRADILEGSPLRSRRHR